MKVKVIKEFLEIPIGSIGQVTTQQGEPIEAVTGNETAMWIKFDGKDMPVGICLPFGMFIAIQKEEVNAS